MYAKSSPVPARTIKIDPKVPRILTQKKWRKRRVGDNQITYASSDISEINSGSVTKMAPPEKPAKVRDKTISSALVA